MTGQNVLLNVEEELRQEIGPVQTLLLKTAEMTAKETALKREIVTHRDARVGLSKYFLSLGFWHIFRLRQIIHFILKCRSKLCESLFAEVIFAFMNE